MRGVKARVCPMRPPAVSLYGTPCPAPAAVSALTQAVLAAELQQGTGRKPSRTDSHPATPPRMRECR
jgi:hypothetical protein